MKDKQSKKVVIIHDIDSESIEKAILILRSGGTTTPAPAGYHIVKEAQEIINAYRKTMEKNQNEIRRREKRARNTRNPSFLWRSLCIMGVMGIFCAFGYWMLSVVPALLNKF
jgi:hypothetical protein